MPCVYLVGFMGSGKSTVGRIVAGRLGLEFVDLDEWIEKRQGRTVSEIFRDSGEARFREIESASLREVATDARVVALGGGAYVDSENRAFIERSGTAVYLEVELSTIRERVEPDGARPLFADAGRVEALYLDRLPSYRMAPVRIATDNRTPDEVADLVVRKLEEAS